LSWLTLFITLIGLAIVALVGTPLYLALSGLDDLDVSIVGEDGHYVVRINYTIDIPLENVKIRVIAGEKVYEYEYPKVEKGDVIEVEVPGDASKPFRVEASGYIAGLYRFSVTLRGGG